MTTKGRFRIKVVIPFESKVQIDESSSNGFERRIPRVSLSSSL